MTNHPIVNGILIGLFSLSLGFGISQTLQGNQVRANTTDISNLKEIFKEEQKRTDARIFQVAEMIRTSNELVKASIGQVEKLVATITAQNEMILRQIETIEKIRTR